MKSASDVLVSRNFQNLATCLFEDANEREGFVAAMRLGEAARPAIIWLSEPEEGIFREERPVAWQPSFVQKVARAEEAGSSMRHEMGAYYCLDLSSVFQASVAQSLETLPNTILDLCASPGGKSIFLSRLFRPNRLLSNEVIRKRLGALLSNLERCKVRASVISADVGRLAEEIGSKLELVFTDAPCSGQSLIARGKKAPSCFHPATINMNSNRQKRIIANAGKLTRRGGHLIYSTCTFSIEENESVVEWFCKRFPEFESVEIPFLADYRSRFSELFAYRLFPQRGEGAGGFTCLLKHQGDSLPAELPDEAVSKFLVRSAYI